MALQSFTKRVIRGPERFRVFICFLLLYTYTFPKKSPELVDETTLPERARSFFLETILPDQKKTHNYGVPDYCDLKWRSVGK